VYNRIHLIRTVFLPNFLQIQQTTLISWAKINFLMHFPINISVFALQIKYLLGKTGMQSQYISLKNDNLELSLLYKVQKVTKFFWVKKIRRKSLVRHLTFSNTLQMTDISISDFSMSVLKLGVPEHESGHYWLFDWTNNGRNSTEPFHSELSTVHSVNRNNLETFICHMRDFDFHNKMKLNLFEKCHKKFITYYLTC
jgi:hypothetical protein